MPRVYHSASSIELGRACPYAWALRYVTGWREPELTFEEVQQIEAEKRQDEIEGFYRMRSLATGKAMHAVAEAHLSPLWGSYEKPFLDPVDFLGHRLHLPYDWESLPGQIFQSGMHHLPEDCEVLVEDGIGREKLPEQFLHCHSESDAYWWDYGFDSCGGHVDDVTGHEAHEIAAEAMGREKKPETGLLIHGVMFAGFVDARFIDPPKIELDRLGLPRDTGILTVDHKTSSNIRDYAKNADDLVKDVQANIYGIDTCERFGQEDSQQRWVYYETKKYRRSAAVDFTIHYDRALEVLEEPCNMARQLDTITSLADADRNPRACGDYGGRPCHVSRGGPCNARRSVGALAQLRRKPKKKDGVMPEKASFAKKFGNKNKKPAETEEKPEEVETQGEEAPTEEPPRQRKKRPAKKTAKKSSAAPPPGSLSEKLVKLSADLAAAEVRCAESEEAKSTAEAALESAEADYETAQKARREILEAIQEVTNG